MVKDSKFTPLPYHNMKTLVFTHGGGRLGNQLINQINLLGFWSECSDEFNVVNLSFSRYAPEYYGSAEECWLGNVEVDRSLRAAFRLLGDGFDQAPGHKLKNFWNTLRCVSLHSIAALRSDAQSILAGSTVKRGVPGTQVEGLNLDDPSDLTLLRAQNLTMLAGWAVRSWRLVRKHRETIRNRVTPNRRYMQRAEQFVSRLRSGVDRVIGVLIRQSDYRTWNEGQYYFNTSQYAEWMNQIDQRMEGSNLFIVASEVPQPADAFEDVSSVFATGEAVGSGHYLESFAELALCDLVLTPPSTFSTLAAFVGDVPIVPLYRDVEKQGFEKLDHHLFDAIEHAHMNKSVK